MSAGGCGLVIKPIGGRLTSVSSVPIADAVYGQADFTSNPRLSLSLYTPTQIAVVGGKLFLTDSTNNRVLIWNSIPTSSHQRPDVVLGQSSLSVTAVNGPYPDGAILDGPGGLPVSNASGFNSPSGICSDGTKLVVSDRLNNRLLIWNAIPTTNAKAADVVLGQPDFTSREVNYDGTISARTLRAPTSVACAAGRLYVSDNSNHRVLFWNSIPTTSFAPADGVLGQASFSTGGVNAPSRSASSMAYPQGINVIGGKLYVADYSNNRILVWSSGTPASLEPAASVLGQTLFTTATANLGGLSAHSLNGPSDVVGIGSRLYVSDGGNRRILVWDTVPASATTDADRVIGQPDFTTTTANTLGISDRSVSSPRGIASDGTKLVYVDGMNHRMMIYDSLPSTSFAAANTVWGQPRMDLGGYNGGIEPDGSLNHPFHLSFDGSHFWIGDTAHSRSLRWPAYRTPFDGEAPDLVLGQSSMSTTSTSLSAGQFRQGNVASDGVKLYQADTQNNRVLIYNAYPTSNGAPADAVLGQPNLTSGTANNGGPNAATLFNPFFVSIADGKLFVADVGNNRVLIWNTLPSANTPADVVLGQPDAISITPNTGGVSGASMSTPACVHVDSGKLFVCDRTNNRILVWNSVPTVTGTPADYVIGQPTLSASGPNASEPFPNAYGMNNVMGMEFRGKRLFVSDLNNSRILVWNSLPTQSGVAATSVIGQPDFQAYSANYVNASRSTLWRPIGLLLHGRDLFVVDYGNHRLVRFSDADRL